MQRIRSALDGQVHHRSHASSILSRVRIGLHFEFLNRVDGRLHHFSATAGRRQLHRIVVDAVHDVIVLAHTLSAGGEAADARPRGRLDRTAGHQRQIQKVAPVQRHVDNALIVDHLPLRRLHRIQAADRGFNVDLLGNRAHFQSEVQFLALVNVKLHAALQDGLEPRQLGANFVSARLQQWD